MEIPDALLSSMLGAIEIPGMARVRQVIRTHAPIDDIEVAVRGACLQAGAPSLFSPGTRVAVGVGSRGIGKLPEIVRSLVTQLREYGCEPFIIPAMGSHGGATAEGQRTVLHHLGVTPEAVGAPIVSDMRTVVLGKTPSGTEVHLDACAAAADAIVFVGRIKPHTAFHGTYESGLAKMIAIGLGNQSGAAATHAHGFGEMAHVVPEMAREALARAPIRLALGVLENAFDEPYKLVAIPNERILADEPALLDEARAAMPRLPYDNFDILVVDRIGKNISGDGADPNITGRYPTPFATGGPVVSKQVVLNLTDESGGNANGIGTADFTTIRAAAKMDLAATYPNALTSTVPRPVAIPMILPNDRLAIAAAVLTCNAVGRPPRIVRISDTLHLETFWVSAALLGQENAGVEMHVDEAAQPLQFDRHGNLPTTIVVHG